MQSGRFGDRDPAVERFSAPVGPTQPPVQWIPALFAAEAWC